MVFKTTYTLKKIVGSAILIPSAPPQNVMQPAHGSVCSSRSSLCLPLYSNKFSEKNIWFAAPLS
jgi:hypothetical protein